MSYKWRNEWADLSLEEESGKEEKLLNTQREKKISLIIATLIGVRRSQAKVHPTNHEDNEITSSSALMHGERCLNSQRAMTNIHTMIS